MNKRFTPPVQVFDFSFYNFGETLAINVTLIYQLIENMNAFYMYISSLD